MKLQTDRRKRASEVCCELFLRGGRFRDGGVERREGAIRKNSDRKHRPLYHSGQFNLLYSAEYRNG